MCSRPVFDNEQGLALPALASGFSLVEVLVALVVAATLSMSLLGGQRQAFELANEFRRHWRQVNYAQEFFAARPPQSFKEPSPAWIAWPEKQDVDWLLEVRDEPLKAVGEDETPDEPYAIDSEDIVFEDTNLFDLTLRIDGAAKTWQWIGQ